MNYIGSKVKLLPFLQKNIELSISKDLKDCVFCDMFAGTGSVGKCFKPKVKQIIANDKEYYSFILNQNYLSNNIEIKNKEIYFNALNSDILTPPIEGKIYNHYCLGHSQRQYFSDYNGAKIDAIRTKIESWHKSGEISQEFYFHLLASLLESADKVANTASVYGAFLKSLKKTATKQIILKPATTLIQSERSGEFFTKEAHNVLFEGKHQVFNTDSNILINKIKGDILYLDPPYNAREYGANYHLLNTIALYDDFIPQGKTGLRKYTKSAYCKKREAANALESLIKNAKFEWIFLSYNDEGILKLEEIQKILEKYGKYSQAHAKHQRFKADSKRIHKQDSTIEYLHILHKG